MAIVPKKSVDLPTGELKFIGLWSPLDAEGDIVYQNIVLTVKDGVITEAVKQDACFTPEDAINDATHWIDDNYYDE